MRVMRQPYDSVMSMPVGRRKRIIEENAAIDQRLAKK